MKKLYRSRDHKMLSGILGGLGEHFDIDPNILRLVFLLFLFGTGLFPGVLIYLIGAFAIPEAPHITHSTPVDDSPAV